MDSSETGIGKEAQIDVPLDALGLPKRALNALRAGGITTLAEIVEWPERELRALPNCGPATMVALRDIAERMGVKLGRAIHVGADGRRASFTVDQSSRRPRRRSSWPLKDGDVGK